ncbi:MAG TPA: hypothetical protein DCY56_04535 [Candidatus Omnitrophica bacterium]|nr:hypothetical protein [Candidatus Omnitrophota bacterium]
MEEKIKNIMSSVFEIKASKIDETTSPDTAEKWDSLNHMILVVALEEEFNVEFTGEEIVEMISYPLIKIVIKEKMENQRI